MENENTASSTTSFQYGLKDMNMILIPVIMIILAELTIYADHLKAGIILHVAVLILISLSSLWMRDTGSFRSVQVLSLLPLLRLLNISMPIFSELTLNMYFFIYAPLFIPIYIIVREQGITKKKLGITFNNMTSFIPMAIGIGFLIAYGENLVINAGYLIPDMSFSNLLHISIIMIFFVGLGEELIFRSLLQTRLEASIGSFRGLILASLLFGVMHSGYGTIYEIFFTSFAGLILGYMFQKTNSLPFVSLTHGFVNIFLFGFIPLYMV